MNTELQDKILAVTNGTKFGCILRCAMDRNVGGKLPQFVGRATLTSDGFVICDFIDSENNGYREVAVVGALSDLLDNGRRLVNHMKLPGAEAKEVGKLLAQWVGNDLVTLTDDDWLQKNWEQG